MNKTCFKCLREKPIEDFYRHPGMADGHLNKCKECTKADTKADYRSKPEAHREYEKNREQSPIRKANKLEYQRRHRALHAVQSKTRSITQHALSSGRLVPQPCEKCGATDDIQAHHEDYYKPLEVNWLCFKCHRLHHGQTILPSLP